MPGQFIQFTLGLVHIGLTYSHDLTRSIDVAPSFDLQTVAVGEDLSVSSISVRVPLRFRVVGGAASPLSVIIEVAGGVSRLSGRVRTPLCENDCTHDMPRLWALDAPIGARATFALSDSAALGALMQLGIDAVKSADSTGPRLGLLLAPQGGLDLALRLDERVILSFEARTGRMFAASQWLRWTMLNGSASAAIPFDLAASVSVAF